MSSWNNRRTYRPILDSAFAVRVLVSWYEPSPFSFRRGAITLVCFSHPSYNPALSTFVFSEVLSFTSNEVVRSDNCGFGIVHVRQCPCCESQQLRLLHVYYKSCGVYMYTATYLTIYLHRSCSPVLFWKIALSLRKHHLDTMLYTMNVYLHTIIVVFVEVTEEETHSILKQTTVSFAEGLIFIVPFVFFQDW